MAQGRSPLKDSPLRNPGQSLDEEIQRVIDDQLVSPYFGVVAVWLLAFWEWMACWRDTPRQPWVISVVAVLATTTLIWHVRQLRQRIRKLKQGRDGERTVAEYLEGFREDGARVFHDIPAPGFNVDHVLISTRGIFVIETKTITKPAAGSKVYFDGERVSIDGKPGDAAPVTQAVAEAKWIRELLTQSTGRPIDVRGVVVYPGWWVEQTHKERPRRVWVLALKALGGWIDHEPQSMTSDDVAMAAFHLSRYVRGESHT